MSDYTKLIEWLRADVLCSYEETKHMQGLAADAIQALCRACANYAEQATEQEWIPVKERLPKHDMNVLICYDWTGRSGTVYREIGIASIEELARDPTEMFRPVAWMPLPTPPKEDET